MFKFIVPALIFWICTVDIRTHRIPNPLTLLLAVALLFDAVSAELYGFLIASPLSLLIAFVGKVGAGDVKLFLLLVATSGSLVLTPDYFLGMAVTSLLARTTSLVISHLKGSELPRSIAFAPSILIPFLLLSLAI